MLNRARQNVLNLHNLHNYQMYDGIQVFMESNSHIFLYTYCNNKALFLSLPKLYADIEIRTEKCTSRNAKFYELVEIIFILGAIRLLHNLLGVRF